MANNGSRTRLIWILRKRYVSTLQLLFILVGTLAKGVSVKNPPAANHYDT
jgi:hypothetical protein